MKWIIQASPFGYPMYASNACPVGWSDRRDEATVFDERDSRPVKLTYFSALLSGMGLPSETVAVEA